MEQAHDPWRMRQACDEARARGERVGLVPTMGALHAGHLALIDDAARRGATYRVVTIFVNPLQFGAGEDLSRYPRALEDDLARCTERGVDLVVTPEPRALYPDGFQTYVEVETLTKPFEGTFRPTHFRGVTTIVAKLFALAGPCLAVFGRKDYQQWKVIERMARDLDLPVDVVAHPTVREADGLALSSRNRYLEGADRERALGIVTGLRAAARAFDGGERDARRLESLARTPVETAFDAIDYVALADAETLAPVADRVGARAVILAAARIGSTRLIDNLVLGEGQAGW